MKIDKEFLDLIRANEESDKLISKNAAIKALQEKYERTRGYAPLMSEGIMEALYVIRNM